MIDFSMPYSVNWAVYHLNVDTWDEQDPVSGVVSVTVDRDCTDNVPLLETSSMVLDTYTTEAFHDGWYRVIANILQEPSSMRVPVTTQYFTLDTDTYDPYHRMSGDSYGAGVKQVKASGSSSLLPASEILMRDGSYVQKNVNGAEWVVRQLRSVVKAPVYLEGDGFSLKRHVVYDSNDSVLSAIWSVLDAGKWCMQIDGNGIITVKEKPTEPDLTLTYGNLRLLHPTLKRAMSKKGIPNRYIVRDGYNEVIAVNDDPSSETSTVSVGRFIDAKIDTSPYLLAGESVQAYARRRLEEESTVSITYDYTREYYPGVYPLGMIRASLPDMDMVGDLRVAKQKITLDQGLYFSETSTLEHKYWKAT